MFRSIKRDLARMKDWQWGVLFVLFMLAVGAWAFLALILGLKFL